MKNTPGSASSRSTRPKKTSSRRGTGRSPRQVARDIAVARRVRPLVDWTQAEGLRRLAFALRPLIDEGLDAASIAAELHAWWLDWQPARPAAYITGRLRRRGVGGPGAPTEPTPAFRAACADTGPGGGVAGATAPVPVEAIPRGTVVELRAAAAADPDLVVASIEYRGMRDTRRLFTGGLVGQALARAFRLSGRAVVGP
ncbi:hypothetical protein [Streptomyces sp. URMC 125]|uniref:hypothetical protein n=1 Tax=Streptomyces sp. URMC 125 TaxID=3423419 RepID=UPI003F1CB82B